MQKKQKFIHRFKTTTPVGVYTVSVKIVGI